MAKKNVKKMKASARLAKEIARRDWLTYISPRGTVDIERSLANFVLRATKGMKPEPNEMDVLSALAGFHWQCRDKMAEIRDDYKQMEVLLPALQNRAIHLFVGDKGKKYVCDTPLFPLPPKRLEESFPFGRFQNGHGIKKAKRERGDQPWGWGES